MANGIPWTDDELRVLEENPEMSSQRLAGLLPNRTPQAIGNKRNQTFGNRGNAFTAEPPVKPAGDYLETVSAYLVDDFECMQIWLKWNGYASYRELNRDLKGMFGYATVLCTAK